MHNLTTNQLIKIIDNCWESILIVERNSKIIYANNAFLMLIGYAKEKVFGTPMELFIKNKYQEEFEHFLNKLHTSEVQSFIQVICTAKDNHELALHISAQVIEDTEFIVLNIKQNNELILKEKKQKIEKSKAEALKRNNKQKEEHHFLDKTMDWLGGANKAFDSLFHHEDKKTKKKKKDSKKSSSAFIFPKGIDLFTKDELRELVKTDLHTFTSIDYSQKSAEELIAAKEWHTWQVCIMLRLYQMGDRLFIADKNDFFPQNIQDLSRHNLEQVIHKMLNNIKLRANINAKKEILQKDAKWSAFEVACLLYFILE